jgi:hypothetical protein
LSLGPSAKTVLSVHGQAPALALLAVDRPNDAAARKATAAAAVLLQNTLIPLLLQPPSFRATSILTDAPRAARE